LHHLAEHLLNVHRVLRMDLDFLEARSLPHVLLVVFAVGSCEVLIILIGLGVIAFLYVIH